MDSLQKSDGLLTFQDLKGAFIDLCFILTMDKRTKGKEKGVVANTDKLSSNSSSTQFCFSFTALINSVSSSCFQRRSSKKENPVCTTCSVEQLTAKFLHLQLVYAAPQWPKNTWCSFKFKNLFSLTYTHTPWQFSFFFVYQFTELLKEYRKYLLWKLYTYVLKL